MEENIMTYEEIENTEVAEVNEEPEEAGKSNLGAIVLTVGAVVGGAIAVAHFTKKKREAWREKRLAKKGYVKLKPGEYVVSDEECEDCEISNDEE